MLKELLKAYADIDLEFKLLEEKKAEAREKILVELKKNELEKVETDFGRFTVAHKTTWKYTDAVAKIADKLKIAKAKEEQKGLAKPVVSEYLLFTKPEGK